MKDIIKEFKISKATTYSGRRYNLFLFDYGYTYTINDAAESILFRLAIHIMNPYSCVRICARKTFKTSLKHFHSFPFRLTD